MLSTLVVVAVALSFVVLRVQGFTPLCSNAKILLTSSQPSAMLLHMNFLKDLFGDAFENDASLSQSDLKKGQLEAINIRPDVTATMTETQKAWRQRQAGAPIMGDMLVGTTWTLDLYLAGVPDKDPSNDLYGSRTNISSRDRSSGLDLPSTPTIESLQIEFLEDNECRVQESPFTSGKVVGQWKLSDDGTILRFSIDTLGYKRTVQTKGSIENVFWTNEPEKSVQTSTSYNIPPGWVYGDVKIVNGYRPGILQFPENGILRIEQSMGLLGAATKLVPCGTFEAKQMFDDRV